MEQFNIADLTPEAQQQFMEQYVWPRVEASPHLEATPRPEITKPEEGDWNDVINAQEAK